MECKICYEKEKNIVILSKCKHQLCFECIQKLKKKKCPFCRRKLDEIFNSNKIIDIDDYSTTYDDEIVLEIDLNQDYLNSWNNI